MTSFICFLVTAFAIVVGVITWFNETPSDKAKRWHQAGLSRTKIATRLGTTRYKVNKLLATV